jgi:acyl-CoA reductase-like NAD-dependent aldehyde dehydrogenase
LVQEVPFAGYKSSGIGVENGTAGLKGWCQIRSIYLSKAKA